MFVQPINRSIVVGKGVSCNFPQAILNAVTLKESQAGLAIEPALVLDALKMGWMPLDGQTPLLGCRDLDMHQCAQIHHERAEGLRVRQIANMQIGDSDYGDAMSIPEGLGNRLLMVVRGVPESFK